MTEFNKPTQEKDWDALAERQLAALKRSTKATTEDALVRAAHKVMAEEDEAFNEIERQSQQRKEAVKANIKYAHRLQLLCNLKLKTQEELDHNRTLNEVLQRIKELRPAIMPLEGMDRGKATHEWFDILAKDIEGMKK